MTLKLSTKFVLVLNIHGLLFLSFLFFQWSALFKVCIFHVVKKT